MHERGGGSRDISIKNVRVFMHFPVSFSFVLYFFFITFIIYHLLLLSSVIHSCISIRVLFIYIYIFYIIVLTHTIKDAAGGGGAEHFRKEKIWERKKGYRMRKMTVCFRKKCFQTKKAKELEKDFFLYNNNWLSYILWRRGGGAGGVYWISGPPPPPPPQGTL